MSGAVAGGRTLTEGGTHYAEKMPLTSSSTAAAAHGRQTNEPIHLDSLYGPSLPLSLFLLLNAIMYLPPPPRHFLASLVRRFAPFRRTTDRGSEGGRQERRGINTLTVKSRRGRSSLSRPAAAAAAAELLDFSDGTRRIKGRSRRMCVRPLRTRASNDVNEI